MPELLKHSVMKDMASSSSGPDWGPCIISPLREQKPNRNICWAIQTGASMEGKVNQGRAKNRMSLSSQFLINEMGDQSIPSFRGVSTMLETKGIPEEQECSFIGKAVPHPPKIRAGDMVKLKSFSYKDFESKIKDKDVLDLLVDGPVVGVLESTTELSSLSSKNIYDPPPLKNCTRHCVLITRYGEDVDSGSPYWYCRESRGAEAC